MFNISMVLIPIAAVLAAFLTWWAHREQSQGLVKFAAIVLLGPWMLSLMDGPGAAVLLMWLFPTSWLAAAVAIAMAIVSRNIRRKELEARRDAVTAD
jgi:hypothetical protein